MGTDLHNLDPRESQMPRNPSVSFEKRDVQASTIYNYLFVLALAVIAAFLACVYVQRVTVKSAEESDAPPPPSRTALGPTYRTLPPEPRLQGVPGHQTDPQQDLRDKLKADTQANEVLEWVDKDAGIARIPVKDAMKIIVERGLPVVLVPPADKRN
jgi:hypothetical protein